MKLINGKEIAQEYLADIKTRVDIFKQQHSITPKLSVVLVGKDPASEIYVRNKINKCRELDLESQLYQLSDNTTEAEILSLIENLNTDPDNHGILVQLPLPDHINRDKIINSINPYKDVDGFHPQNISALYLNQTTDSFIPCTPLGCCKILQNIGFEIQGAHVVIVGRSNIVGKPLAMLLLQKGNASISMLHSKSKDPQSISKKADLIISAVGVPNLISPEWVKEGAVVIDVGMNRIKPKGKLQGDADLPALLPIVKAITPVPGGVGPMTIAMLMANTLKAAEINIRQNA